MAKMKEMPTDDPLFGKGEIRADGRKIHDMYLFQVKAPDAVEGPVGLLRARRHHPGRRGVPPARRRRLPAREVAATNRRDGPSVPPIRTARTAPMFELLGIPPQALFGQLLLGLINGSFYALLSLGLAVIFGLLNIINFAHGAQYMMGAFVRLDAARTISASATGGRSSSCRSIVGAIGIVIERCSCSRALPSRPSLRPAAHLRPGADHPGAVPQPVRRLRPALSGSRRSSPAARISASCSCRTTAAG